MHLHRIHGIGKQEYQRRYPGALVTSETLRAHFRDLARDRAFDKEPARATRASNGEIVERRIYWTAELVIDAALAWKQAYGRPPSAEQWRKVGTNPILPHPSLKAVERRFGSWNAFMAAAGFEPRPADGTWRLNSR